MRRSPGWPGWLLRALLATALAGCDASGSTQGGAPVTADRCADPDLGHTWTDLYDCYFGPSGKTSCVAQGFCHGGPNQLGALYPNGWTCGTTRESCWQGMWQVQPQVMETSMVCTNVAPPTDAGSESGGADASEAGPGPDGGGEAGDAASDASAAVDGNVQTDGGDAGPAVPVVCVIPSDPTQTKLWSDLRGATGGIGLLHRMPYAQPGVAGVSFTPRDLDRISAWIREGAQDN